jgi:WD40 repeat protein
MNTTLSVGLDYFVQTSQGIILVGGVALLALAILVFVLKTQLGSKQENKYPRETNTQKQKKKKDKNKEKQKLKIPHNYTLRPSHPLILAKLKGHTDQITAVSFSPTGKFFVSCSLDRTLRLYFVDSFKGKDIRHTQVATDYDYATSCSFSSDGNHLVLSLGNSKRICGYRVSETRNAEGKYYKLVKEFPTEHKSIVKSVCVAPNNQFIITCSADTEVKIWSPKGQLLDFIDTKQARNNMCVLSKDSRYFAVAAFTGDVRIWELLTDKKSGLFVGVKKPHIGNLMGHNVLIKHLNL